MNINTRYVYWCDLNWPLAIRALKTLTKIISNTLPHTRKKWFCYGNKIRDKKYFFLLLQPKILLQQLNVLLIEPNIFFVVTKHFCYPYFDKLICWYNKTFYTVQRCHSETVKFILKDLFSSVLSQFKKCHPSGNLKCNYSGIFQSLNFRILKEKILSISLKLNFTPNTLGYYELKRGAPNVAEL